MFNIIQEFKYKSFDVTIFEKDGGYYHGNKIKDKTYCYKIIRGDSIIEYAVNYFTIDEAIKESKKHIDKRGN